MICPILYRSLTSLYSYLPASALLSLPLLLSRSLLALLLILSRRQSLMASVFGAKGDIEAVSRPSGQGRLSVSLSRHYEPQGGGRGGSRSNAGTVLGSSGS